MQSFSRNVRGSKLSQAPLHSHQISRGGFGGGTGGGIPAGKMFDEGLGKLKVAGQGLACVGRHGQPCGQRLAAGVEDYYTETNEGPLCEDHFVDKWVQHHMQNSPRLPLHEFGVNWGKHEEQISALITSTVNQMRARANRYPTKEELQLVLSQMSFSRECPKCEKLFQGKKYAVQFTPEVDDFTIPGVNAPDHG